MGAAGFAEDAAFPDALAEDRQRVVGVAHQRQHADELCAALGVRDILHGLQQLGVVRRVAPAVGIARRVDARRAAEEVHRQPGVVGQRRQAGEACGVACLEDGVLDEGKTGFLRFHLAELADRAHLHAGAEHGLEFLEFAGIVAGQHQLFELDHSSGKISLLKLKVCAGSPLASTLMVKTRVSRWLIGNCARL